MEESGPLISVDCIVNDQWKVQELIAQGGFGSIFKAYNLNNKSDIVAIKTEKRANRDYLTVEADIYNKLVGLPGFPRLIWFGKTKFYKPGNPEKHNCCVLVLEYLSSSLSDLFTLNNKKFSLKTVLMLSQQMIDRLATLHAVGIVHRDVKPGNFVMGKGDKAGVVYLLDFGLAHPFKDENTNIHMPYQTNVCFRGTHRYASVTAHARIEQSRRDDMEALGYVLIYFLRGLPWQNLQIERKDRRKVIGDMKAKLPLDKLTEGLPIEFEKYMQYTRSLRFTDEPNYVYCKNLFENCFAKLNFVNDGIYDWMATDKNGKGRNNDIFADDNNVSTASEIDKDNSYNDQIQLVGQRGKSRRVDLADEDEDVEYYPAAKKKKGNPPKFNHSQPQQQNDWNSDEYIEAKNTTSVFIDNVPYSPSAKNAKSKNGRTVQAKSRKAKK